MWEHRENLDPDPQRDPHVHPWPIRSDLSISLPSFDLILHRLKEGDKFSLNADGKMFEDDVAMTNTCVEATIN